MSTTQARTGSVAQASGTAGTAAAGASTAASGVGAAKPTGAPPAGAGLPASVSGKAPGQPFVDAKTMQAPNSRADEPFPAGSGTGLTLGLAAGGAAVGGGLATGQAPAPSDGLSPEPLVMNILFQLRLVVCCKIFRHMLDLATAGEHVNSFVRVQFADFDFKDVGPIALAAYLTLALCQALQDKNRSRLTPCRHPWSSIAATQSIT
nr:hypothetical protein HK105_003211 [Polyrhizophydium stewartii]